MNAHAYNAEFLVMKECIAKLRPIVAKVTAERDAEQDPDARGWLEEDLSNIELAVHCLKNLVRVHDQCYPKTKLPEPAKSNVDREVTQMCQSGQAVPAPAKSRWAECKECQGTGYRAPRDKCRVCTDGLIEMEVA